MEVNMKSKESIIEIAKTEYKVNEPLTYGEFLSMVCAATLGFTEQLIEQIPENERDKAKAEFFDAANSCFGKLLDLAFPDVLKTSDIDSDTLLEAQNKVLKEMAEKTDKIVPMSLKK